MFHPVLFAIYPILFLFSHNIREVSFGQILIPILLSVAFVCSLWVLLNFLMRDRVRSGLVTTVFALFFFSYGHLFELFKKWGISFTKHEYMIPAAVVTWGVIFFFVKGVKNRKNLEIVTKIFNAAGVALIAVNLFGILSYQFSKHVTPIQDKETSAHGQVESHSLPDIYYIILDEFANLRSVKNIYDYDNSRFADSLADRGFYISKRSKTAYSDTERSIAAALNMNFLGEHEDPFQMIEHNRVVGFLKKKGYTFIHFANYHKSTNRIKGADLYFNFYENNVHACLLGDFYMILLNTTMLRPLYQYFFDKYYSGYSRGAILSTFYHLEKVPGMRFPKFVFAHIMCPHEPFVFGPSGERIDKKYRDDWKTRHVYLGQYLFTCKRALRLIDGLLGKSKTPPIIILQSDHGPRTRKDRGAFFGDEWKWIFNAFYLPGDGRKMLYDSISPVNSFRLIFNHYFNANYDLIKER